MFPNYFCQSGFILAVIAANILTIEKIFEIIVKIFHEFLQNISSLRVFR